MRDFETQLLRPFNKSCQLVWLIFFLIFSAAATAQTGQKRYFFEGDGRINIEGGEKKLKNLSPRLVALLDYFQDSLTAGKGQIEIFSGYRSPEYNENLRRQGKLAAKATLHAEGMAADFVLAGVEPKKLWEFIREMKCCGAGYYAGRMVHVDTGPPRFWDEKTSKVFTDIADHNKQIYSTTAFDIYSPQEKIVFKIVRVTEYPFGVKKEAAIVAHKKTLTQANLETDKGCTRIQNRKEAQNWSLVLPRRLPLNQNLHIQLHFCEKPSPKMPDFVLSNPFMIR